MTGITLQEIDLLRQILINKLRERFPDPLPGVLLQVLQTWQEDPNRPGRFRELLTLATETQNLVEFLQVSMYGPGSHGGPPLVLQTLEGKFGTLPNDAIRKALQSSPDSPTRLQELLDLAVRTDVTDMTMFLGKAMLGPGSHGGPP